MAYLPNNFNEILLNLLESNEDFASSEYTTRILQALVQTASADIVLFFSISPDNFINFEQSYINIPDRPTPTVPFSNFFPAEFIPEIYAKQTKLPHEICVSNHEIFNTFNFYQETEVDIDSYKKIDDFLNYFTVSLLAFPLYNAKKVLIGAIQMVNPRDDNGKIINFNNEMVKKLSAIGNLLAIQTDLNNQTNSYNRLLESFIEVIAKAIDNKSPYTGEHCQKVPVITRMLASAAIDAKSGPFKNFEMSENEWYALHIASLLHDCGKITTPDYIVDKSTKLETPYNRIHEIRNRFEILRRDAHIEYLQKRLNNVDTQANLQAEFVAKVKKLTEDFAFIGQCNIGDNPLTENDIKRLDDIAQTTYTRNFSRMVGLSWNEKNLIDDVKKAEQPEEEHLLDDRPEQLKTLYNQGELTNLKIKTGTINELEREKINEHVQTTIDMLKDLSFPPELSDIIEYAGAHHERVDGHGYPNGLTGDQMSIPAKIMAIADVYEALTARDRPYKKPKKLSTVLSIMRDMKNSGHLDPDLYDLFIKSGVYLDYAKDYISSDQIDDINPDEYL